MIKSLFLLLIGGLIGVICNPGWLAAADNVVLSGLNPDGIVETVVLPEPEPEEVSAPEVVLAPEAGRTVQYTMPANYIAINGRTIALEYTDSTAENAGAATLAWYHSGGKFIYGHNTGNVFGFLDVAYDGGWLMGMNFTVSMDGETRNYTVADYRVYDRTGDYTLGYEGYSYGMAPIMRAELLDAPTHTTVPYRMAIMTCYAGSTQRLVVFAN